MTVLSHLSRQETIPKIQFWCMKHISHRRHFKNYAGFCWTTLWTLVTNLNLMGNVHVEIFWPQARFQIIDFYWNVVYEILFTFMHLADAFIQSDLQCIQAMHILWVYVFMCGIEPTTFALLTQCSNHWATGTCAYLRLLKNRTSHNYEFLTNLTFSSELQV